jgi:hypothetical protein
MKQYCYGISTRGFLTRSLVIGSPDIQKARKQHWHNIHGQDHGPLIPRHAVQFKHSENFVAYSATNLKVEHSTSEGSNGNDANVSEDDSDKYLLDSSSHIERLGQHLEELRRKKAMGKIAGQPASDAVAYGNSYQPVQRLMVQTFGFSWSATTFRGRWGIVR